MMENLKAWDVAIPLMPQVNAELQERAEHVEPNVSWPRKRLLSWPGDVI